MAPVSMQRDLVVALKKETSLNVGILSKLQAMPPELSRQIYKDNAMEKPTQNLFNHLSHYLVSIIDAQASAGLSWPLYDTKTERTYRNELSSFITSYSNKGLLSPVMSSYFVNPGCFKVTVLISQMSQLAVQKLLTTKMKKDSQKKLYSDMTEKYKSQETQSFIQEIEKETEYMLSKFSNYLQKRQVIIKIAEALCKKISEMESKLLSLNAQKYIDDLVDGFLSKNTFDEETMLEMLKIKDVSKPSQFFDAWLLEVDRKTDEMESKWSEKITPLTHLAKETQISTESLIARHTGEAEKYTYMIEYNPKTDQIDTTDLEPQVNSQQKYILKNIVKDEKLSFPHLIRGFLIAIGFILKNVEVEGEIYKFNEYLEGGRRNYSELVKAMRDILERVMNAKAKLKPSQPTFHEPLLMNDYPELPPLPDLSDLKCLRDVPSQSLYNSFTPLNMSKHQFNLRRRTSLGTFVKPHARPMLTTPFCHAPKDDFLNSLISCRVSSYDHPNLNTTQNFHNKSAMSQVSQRANETIAECSSGFTKQQILRLLSTKKSSSSKKFKYQTERPDIKIKKGGLFNESTASDDSNGLFRSYSSPNLFENREKRPVMRAGRKRLSVMKEDSPLEVSGIIALDKDSSSDTTKAVNIAANNLLATIRSPASESDINDLSKGFREMNKDILNKHLSSQNNTPSISITSPTNVTENIQELSSNKESLTKHKMALNSSQSRCNKRSESSMEPQNLTPWVHTERVLEHYVDEFVSTYKQENKVILREHRQNIKSSPHITIKFEAKSSGVMRGIKEPNRRYVIKQRPGKKSPHTKHTQHENKSETSSIPAPDISNPTDISGLPDIPGLSLKVESDHLLKDMVDKYKDVNKEILDEHKSGNPTTTTLTSSNQRFDKFYGDMVKDFKGNNKELCEDYTPLEKNLRVSQDHEAIETSTPIESDKKMEDTVSNSILDLNKEILQKQIVSKTETKTETPKNNAQLIRKTSSLEKIINRFKKVRASVLPDESNDIKTIAEEKDKRQDGITANRVLLPDLLSPSCNLPLRPMDYLDQWDQICMDSDDNLPRRPRESLGTALGVDQTFLDQFDLID